MTTLNITANTAKKSARFKGTIAAGEHVAVSIEGVEVASATSLRLRVLGLYGETLAQFPMPESDSGDDGETSPSVAEGEDTWTYEDGVLSCELNLNTVQMLRAVPPAATRRLLFVLDDYDNKTLFFKDVCDVAHWPRRRGEEEPPPDDLDNYKDLIADFNNRLSEAEEDIEDAVSSVQDAVSAVNTAIDSIDGKVGSAVSLAVPEAVANKADKVSPVTSGNFAGLDSNGNLTDSGKKSADFTPASHALDSDIHVTAEQKTAWNGYGASISELQSGKQNALSNNQLAAVNSGITSALVAQIETNKSNITYEASARNNRDNQLAAAISNYASTETAARQDADATLASQISSLSSAKADKATTYTKTEVDTKIAGVQTFQKYLVQTLPDPDEADMKGLYLVPTGETTEVGDLCEEWTVVEENGEKRWEKIGGTTVDISSKQDKLYVVYPGDWTVSAYQHNEQIDAFVDAAVDVDVTITQQGPAQFLYVLTGYDTESYYVTPVVSTARTDNILFGVYDSSATTLYGYVRATLVESRQDVPAEVLSQVVPTGDNLVKTSGIWSAIWGALSALPTGFTSLYDWCVSQLAGKASKAEVDPLLFAQYYPDGNVKSAAEFTPGIKYNAPDTTNRTITVKPFCNTGTAANDNSNLEGRVVIPPFVDAQGNPYISDDGTRYKVVGVSGGSPNDWNDNLTAVVAPSTVTTIGGYAFAGCTSLASVSLPSATTIGESAFADCTSLASVSLPSATTIGGYAFAGCTSLASVSLPSATTIGESAFLSCTSLASVSLPSATTIEVVAFYDCTSLDTVDFGDIPRSSVPSLGVNVFLDVPTTCKIIVPDVQYDAWTAPTLSSGSPNPWYDLVTAGYKFLRHSEWEYARKYEVDKKADKPATFTTGNLAALDANGNPTDSQIPKADVALKGNIPYSLGTPIVIDTASSEVVDGETVYFGAAALANRTANIVQVTAATALDELRITFPAETSGKVRDFGLRVEIGTGSAALAAPALVPVAPSGETIKIENADRAIPELADGTATAKGVTLLYFSENAPGVFVVKGEQVEEVA